MTTAIQSAQTTQTFTIPLPQSKPAQPSDSSPAAPKASDTEKAVLGCFIYHYDRCKELADLIGVDMFYESRHQVIWSCIAEMGRLSLPIDLVTLHKFMANKQTLLGNALDLAGGSQYIASLDAYALPGMIRQYVTDLLDTYAARWIQRQCLTLAREIPQDPCLQKIEALMDRIQSSQDWLRNLHASASDTWRDTVSVVRECISRLDQPGTNAVQTGYPGIDSVTGGFAPPDLWVLAARPGSGKTALALNIVENLVRRGSKDIGIGIISLEMSARQLMHRLACSMAKVNAAYSYFGKYSTEEMRRITEAYATLSSMKNIMIDDTGNLTTQQILRRARRMFAQYPVGKRLLIVDYLQLIQCHGRDRYEQITHAARDMKSIAKELQTPVLLLSQLNRSSENDQRAPRRSDLRDSGAIEEVADMIFLIDKSQSVYDQQNQTDLDVSLNLDKHRNGPEARIRFLFRRPYVRFEEQVLEPDDVARLEQLRAEQYGSARSGRRRKRATQQQLGL